MNSNQPYETLDPEDWEKMRVLAYQMVNDAIDYLGSVSDRPVWQRVPSRYIQDSVQVLGLSAP